MVKTSEIAVEIAKRLVAINAIRLNFEEPFQWASGWLSPIYCDNRLTLSEVEARNFIKQSFVDLIEKEFPEVNCIAGVATAGIPNAALIADALELPMVYIRSKAKEHGKKQQIEGKLPENARVLVIEDLISTGKSSIKAIQALKESSDAEVLACLSVFTYGFDIAQKNFENEKLQYRSLSNLDALINILQENENFSENDLSLLRNWKVSPENWTNK